MKDIDVVIPMYNLVEHSDNYSRTFGCSWQYYRNEPLLTDPGAIRSFPGDGASFKFNKKNM